MQLITVLKALSHVIGVKFHSSPSHVHSSDSQPQDLCLCTACEKILVDLAFTYESLNDGDPGNDPLKGHEILEKSPEITQEEKCTQTDSPDLGEFEATTGQHGLVYATAKAGVGKFSPGHRPRKKSKPIKRSPTMEPEIIIPDNTAEFLNAIESEPPLITNSTPTQADSCFVSITPFETPPNTSWNLRSKYKNLDDPCTTIKIEPEVSGVPPLGLIDESQDEMEGYDDDDNYIEKDDDDNWTPTPSTTPHPQPPPRQRPRLSRRGQDQIIHTCHCGKQFVTQKWFEIHVQSHLPLELQTPRPTPVLNYKCTEPGCTRAFNGYRSLEKHLNSHRPPDQRIRPFECPLCHKRYTTKDSLKSHTRSHTDERNFLCPECGKKFRDGTHLRQHMEIHENLRAYKCEKCGQGFNNRSNLNGHVESFHAEERKEICGICDKSFKTPRQLRVHQKKHEEEGRLRLPSLKCLIPACKVGFDCNEELVTHLIQFHQIQPPADIVLGEGCAS